MKGTVYTETVVHSAPEAFLADAPYQLVIVTLEDGKRLTGRTQRGAARVAIGDRVELAETTPDGITWWARASRPDA